MFSTWLTMSIKMTVVSGSYVGPGPNVATARLGLFGCWKRRCTLTISVAMACVQPADSLQPEVLTRGRGNVTKDTSVQPGFRGSEVEGRRERTANSLFLSEYPGEKGKSHGKQRTVVTSGQNGESRERDLVDRACLYNSGPRSSCCLFSPFIPQNFLKFLCGTMSRIAGQKTKPWV